ncbi:MAG TPA: hypothetical protein VHW23_25840 [Kofleriaceae bacterium]|nr:hypothetical protein [Kofleriaceae bacterium]
MRTPWLIGVVCGLWAWTAPARAAPPEPSGPHPRMLLDAGLRAAWRARSKEGHGPIVGAIEVCDGDRNPREHAGAQYMGSEWKKMLQACLVAWAATGEPDHARTALRYFTALLDDLDTVGDGKGGDAAASRDAGYPIRNLGPYTALAYDWLHDAPGMTPELRARARRRWAAWLTWFEHSGYHPHDPGSNYHAGYLLAATMIAIAQGGEAGEAGHALWREVADRMWGREMAAAWAPGGPLDGGDWDEGWQYAPLSVAEYALGARIVRAHGIRVDGATAWLDSVLRRHVYALTPSDRLWAGGDFDSEAAYMEPSTMTLAAVALGDASPPSRRWAKGELSRLKLGDQDSLLYDALATIGESPVLAPRTSWPTWYRAAGTATLFTRTSWDPHAIWFVAECARTAGLDHRSPNAGNFVLSRGAADLIVDPSPYGSLSTLTGNAPTVRSAQLPGPYQPSQGAWGSAVRWRWATRTAGGVVAARCDYSDAFRFQDRPSDVPEAVRDLVLVPSADGRDAQLVIADRAVTGDAARHMYLRFRVPGELALDAAGTATAQIGDARLAIHGPAGKLGKTALKDCFQPGTERGNCDAARFAVTDYRAELPGPEPRAVHVIDATGPRGGAISQPISGPGWTGVALAGPRDAIVVWPARPGALTYRAPRRRAVSHIVLDVPGADAARVTAHPDGDACAVTIEPGSGSAGPLVATLDERCAVTADPPGSDRPPDAVPPPPPPGTLPSRPPSRPQHAGCCGTGAAPSTPVAMSLLVLGARRRRR